MKKDETEIIFGWQCLKFTDAQNRKCVLSAVCHLLKELVLAQWATLMNSTLMYMHILNNQQLE